MATGCTGSTGGGGVEFLGDFFWSLVSSQFGSFRFLLGFDDSSVISGDEWPFFDRSFSQGKMLGSDWSITTGDADWSMRNFTGGTLFTDQRG